MAETSDIKKNDEVQVIAGKDRGKRGRVVDVLPKKGRVLVEGVARARSHAHPASLGERQQAGRHHRHQELFIDLSNVHAGVQALRQGRRGSATGSRTA